MPGAVNLMIDSVRAVVGDTLGMPRIVRFAVVCGDDFVALCTKSNGEQHRYRVGVIGDENPPETSMVQ